jgi:8-oxo-dGTP diphosphatase
MPDEYQYPRVAVTVDVIVFAEIERAPNVLLVQRAKDPYGGMWALPGGFIEMNENLEASAMRELKEETGVTAKELIQIGAFGDVGRDPRGRTISVAFLTCVEPSEPQAADDAAEAKWFALRGLPDLAFDHRAIVEDGVAMFGRLVLGTERKVNHAIEVEKWRRMVDKGNWESIC